MSEKDFEKLEKEVMEETGYSKLYLDLLFIAYKMSLQKRAIVE